MFTTTLPAPRFTALRAALLSLLVIGASAQDASAEADRKVQAHNSCLNDVSKFEQTIGLLRQAQGNKAASEIKERLLPTQLENEILVKDGYCGLAKYLRDKKLI